MELIELSSIRKQNLRKLLNLLTMAPAMTRQELAKASGLSQMTVTNLVDLFKEQEVLRLVPIQHGQSMRPASGRKADAISLCGEKKAWLVIDISNLQFRLTLLSFDVQPLLEMQDLQQGEYMERLKAFLQLAKERVNEALQQRTLLGIAIVTPGPYEIAKDTVINQRIPQLNHIKIKALFQQYFGKHEYYVDEDVKFAVRACYELYAQEQCEVLYYLYIGEGVGGAAIHGGNMLRGLNATAGDAGHMRDASGHTYESHLNMSAFASMLHLQQTASPKTLEEALALAAVSDQETYRTALNQIARYAAEMLHGTLWMLDPTHIVIDCPYAAPFETYFIQQLHAYLQKLFAGEERTLPLLFPADQKMSIVLRGAVYVLQREWLERILA